jgi:hypothetical protein
MLSDVLILPQDDYAVSHIAGETHLNYPANASN